METWSCATWRTFPARTVRNFTWRRNSSCGKNFMRLLFMEYCSFPTNLQSTHPVVDSFLGTMMLLGVCQTQNISKKWVFTLSSVPEAIYCNQSKKKANTYLHFFQKISWMIPLTSYACPDNEEIGFNSLLSSVELDRAYIDVARADQKGSARENVNASWKGVTCESWDSPGESTGHCRCFSTWSSDNAFFWI